MGFFVGNTDYDWFQFLARSQVDEVNFWRPGGGLGFAALEEGDLFLFKLKSPHYKIVGGGFFSRFTRLPLSLAWKAFEQKNGVPDYPTLLRKIKSYRQDKGLTDDGLDPIIGCIVLSAPFFLPPEKWLDAPADWKPNIVGGKSYNLNTVEGRDVWEGLCSTLNDSTSYLAQDHPALEMPRYAQPRLHTPRLGQGAFRLMVTDAYVRRCAITGEKTLPVLEAAHIRPYAQEGQHRVDNGLLLRSDLHTLFDAGYLTVVKEAQRYRVEVSGHIRQEYGNGRHYYALRGKDLEVLPETATQRPSGVYLEWHNNTVFKP